MPTVRYDAPPTLSRFLDSDAFVRVVMGPVGSGKSSACVLEILRRAMEQAPGPDGLRRTRFVVVRNTYPELRDTTRKTFEHWVPPDLGTWNAQEFSFHMRFKDVDCEVLFRALDRGADVKKLLSLELTGCYFNELREIAKDIFDGMQGRVGRYPSAAQGGATWFGVWADTNPWHKGHWGSELFASPPEGFELYRQPGGLSPDAENVSHLPAGYYERLCRGKSKEWVDVYVHAKEAFSDVGAIFGPSLELLTLRGGVCEFQHFTTDIFVNYDLGIGDAMALWFWRVSGAGVDFVDHYANSGKGLQHYFDILDSKAAVRGYQYRHHWLPHDARARSLQTGISTVERFARHCGRDKVSITPELSIPDGLEAARWLLEESTTRFHMRCEGDADGEPQYRGLKALREYRYAWDDEKKVFSKKPLHDWASNTADAFRYTALVVKYSELLTRPKPAVQRPPPARSMQSLTLDELFREAEANEGRRW